MQTITAREWIEAAESQLKGHKPSQAEDDVIVGLLELCADSPNLALEIILGVAELKPRSEVIDYLGAGPLEDLLVKNCNLLEIVVNKASRDPVFKQCLSQVNLDERDCENASLLSDFFHKQ